MFKQNYCLGYTQVNLPVSMKAGGGYMVLA